MHGGKLVEVVMYGYRFDDACAAAVEDNYFIHPFYDEKGNEGQAIVGLEIVRQSKIPIDYLIVPIICSGFYVVVSSVFRELSSDTKNDSVEPTGAPSM
jgi:threonine dehydratase